MVVVAVALVTVLMMVVVVVIMTAGAVVAVLVVVMVVTVGLTVVRQYARQQLGDSEIRFARAACVELNARIVQRQLRAHADATADQGVDAQIGEHARQRAVAGAVGGNHFLRENLVAVHCVKLELLRVTKVLEDLTVFVRNCDFHDKTSLTILYSFIINRIAIKSKKPLFIGR